MYISDHDNDIPEIARVPDEISLRCTEPPRSIVIPPTIAHVSSEMFAFGGDPSPCLRASSV